MSIPGVIALTVLSVFVLLLAIVLFLKIRVEISFEKSGGERAKVIVRLSFLKGRIKKNLDFSKSRKKDKKEENKEDKEKLSFTKKVKKYQEIFTKLRYVWSKSGKTVRKNIFVEKLDLSVDLGMEDAAVTGIATGSLWALVYTVMGFISDIVRICVPKVSITPDYDNERFCAKAECIIGASPANIISIGAKILLSYYLICRKMKKQTKKEKAAINYGNTN